MGKGLTAGLGVFLVVVMGAGCVQKPMETRPPVAVINMDPLENAPGADMQRAREVELVEMMGRHREEYIRLLERLRDFYDAQGHQLKADWARGELEHMRLYPRRQYLVVAEMAGPNLQARQPIPQADDLYSRGMELFREGRGSLGPMFANQKTLSEAIEVFNSIIINYPTSDKIDDAAFQIAEIYNHYLEEYLTAMLYYQRVWQWDPNSPYPARHAVARLYDEHRHDRIKALEYYQLALEYEPNHPEMVEHARNRIEKLSVELAR